MTPIAPDSFYLPDELVEAFEAETGLDRQIQLSGDAGAMANHDPGGEGVVDADDDGGDRPAGGEQADALEASAPEGQPESVAEHGLDGDTAAYLTPVDYRPASPDHLTTSVSPDLTPSVTDLAGSLGPSATV